MLDAPRVVDGLRRASPPTGPPRIGRSTYLRGLGDEVVLVREEREPRPAGDADLRVDVLHVVLGGAARDHQPLGDLRVRAAGRDQPRDLDLALAEAGRAAGCPGAGAGSRPRPRARPITASPSSRPARTSRCSSAAACSASSAGRCGRSWVIAWKASAAARIRTAGARSRRAAAAVVARPVEPLVVHAGDAGHRLERLGRGQDALRVVRVHPHLLPLGGGQRAGLLPDRVRDRDAAEVARAARRPRAGTAVCASRRSARAAARGELGHAARVAVRPRAS